MRPSPSTRLEQVIKGRVMESRYSDPEIVREKVKQGKHRHIIGGMWDEIGQLQLDYMKSKGLTVDHKLLDIGCGSFRGGIRFIRYLTPGYYYGFDLNMELIKAGLEVEVKNAGLGHRVQIKNFAAGDNFQYSSHWPNMDAALGFSLLTHLNHNSLRQCLKKTSGVLKKGGRFYATIFEVSKALKDAPYEQIPGIVSYPSQDPYHYTHNEIESAAKDSGVKLIDIENFGHPRRQKMAIFERCKS